MMRIVWVFVTLLVISGCVLAQNPNIPADAVVNGASFAQKQQVAPGSLVSIFGSQLAQSMASADSVPLGTKLGNVEVMFNGVPAPLLIVVPDGAGHSAQINAQVPWNVLPQGTTSGTVNVVATVNGVMSNSSPVQIGASAPGIFTLNSAGTGQAAVQIGNSTVFAAPAGSIQGAQSRPVKKGEVLVIYATGVGPVNSDPANGDIPHGPTPTTMTMPNVMFGGVPADPGGVQFSGLSPQFVGLNQINVTVPQAAPSGSAVSLQLEIGGVTTSNQVTIAIE
jgi:uncharacterized protein (TIGR03437 family)